MRIPLIELEMKMENNGNKFEQGPQAKSEWQTDLKWH